MYLEVIHETVAGTPSINLDTEKRVQELCISLIEKGLLRSAHDCSMGGLGVALALCAVRGQIGFSGEIGVEGRWDAVLFGERQSRIVVSVAPGDVEGVRKMAEESGVTGNGAGGGGGRPADDMELHRPTVEGSGAGVEKRVVGGHGVVCFSC